MLAILGSFAELEHELSGARTRHATQTNTASGGHAPQYELPLLRAFPDLRGHFKDAWRPSDQPCINPERCSLEKSGH